MNIRMLLLLPVTLIAFSVGTHAQDYRNDMFGQWRTRAAGYEPIGSPRSVTQLDPLLAPFYHGVASGDPLPTAVVLWTRVTTVATGPVTVEWRIARDTALQQIVRQGQVTTGPERDYTVKIDVQDLEPGTVYYYGFSAGGRHSLTGRTRTAPAGSVDQARFAIVSCSNYPAGYFNAYAKIADRNDLDAVLHLGDYIYEYDADTTSFGGQVGKRLGRLHDPDKELIQLVDYRTRYSQYRLDPDLRRLHQQIPMLHVWDDHESANDAYTDGAQNHQASEGSWETRKTVSKQACYDWLPTRDAAVLYRSVTYGDLAEVFMLDTRLDGRDQQVDDVGPDASPAAKATMNDPARRIISDQQETWLKNGMAASTSTWKILGNQVMFSPVSVNPIDTAFLFDAVGPLFAALLRSQVPLLQGLFESAFYGDVWNNYPAARRRLMTHWTQQNLSNIVIATGDFHTAFAFDVVDSVGAATPARAVEFMTPSISANNFDENLSATATIRPIAPQLVASVDHTLTSLNKHLKFVQLTEHGYVILDVKRDRVQGDYYFMDTLYVRPSAEQYAAGYVTLAGTSALQRVTAPATGKAIQDVPAPPDPPLPTSVGQTEPAPCTIMGVGPQPARDLVYLSYHLAHDMHVSVSIMDMQGAVIDRVFDAEETAGLHSVVINVQDLPSGRYGLMLQTGTTPTRTAIVIVR